MTAPTTLAEAIGNRGGDYVRAVARFLEAASHFSIAEDQTFVVSDCWIDGLMTVLEEKGIITKDEWIKATTAEMNRRADAAERWNTEYLLWKESQKSPAK